MICRLCGSIFDADGNHTDEWRSSQKIDGKTMRPKLYRVWATMRERCNNPRQCRYQYYGGKGVRVCEEWSDYGVFRIWAISNGYEEGLVIDRLDSDRDYCPENCRWVTHLQNQPQLKLTDDNVREIRNSKKSVENRS